MTTQTLTPALPPVPASVVAAIRAQAQAYVGDAVEVTRDRYFRVLSAETRDVQGTILNGWAEPMGYITRQHYMDHARTLFGFTSCNGAGARLYWLSRALA